MWWWTGVRQGQSTSWALFTNALGGPVYEAFPEPVGCDPPLIQKSMSLKYEPASEPLHISVKLLFLN